MQVEDIEALVSSCFEADRLLIASSQLLLWPSVGTLYHRIDFLVNSPRHNETLKAGISSSPMVCIRYLMQDVERRNKTLATYCCNSQMTKLACATRLSKLRN